MALVYYSGNLGLSHDLSTIVYAAHYANARAEFWIRFAGNGKAKQSLYKLTERLGLMNVGFYPPVPIHKLPVMLRQGDMHFVAQKMETEGLVVPSKAYSIMAVGRPTIFIGPEDSEVGTIIRESESGIIVRPGDVEGAANAIVKLTLDKDLRERMGARAQEYYEEHLGQEKAVARIVQAVENAV